MSDFGSQEMGSAVVPCKTETQTDWIEIELVGEDDKPVPFVAYRAVLPDGKAVAGYLDDTGFARLDGIPPGTCAITFTELDAVEWEFIETVGARSSSV